MGSASIKSPTLLQETPPDYPEHSTAQGTVLLTITVSIEGRAQDVKISESVSPAVDAAAQDAVHKWRFSPALRGNVPIAARIKVAVPMAPPLASTVPSTKSPSRPPQKLERHTTAPATTPKAEGNTEEVTVHGERALRSERRSASDFYIHSEVLKAAPHQSGVDVLRAAPGLTVMQGEGLALAPSYTLRGFDAEHGQDIEFQVGGLPINLPSHIHGQGYANMGFLLEDVVDQISISEGVSDPRQGDFAVAGTLRVGLGVDEEQRGLKFQVSYGSFDTKRFKMIWAPKEGQRESLGAAHYTTTRGYGDNRSAQSATAIVQHRFGSGKLTYRAVGFVYAADSDTAGVLRQDDIDEGNECYHCVYPFATATAQGGSNQRFMAGIFADYRGKNHANGTLGLYAGRDNYRSALNYTGFLETSRALPGQSGRGDLIEQSNYTENVGMEGRYRSEAFDFSANSHGTFEAGVDGRFYSIKQKQNLIDATVHNQIWDERIDANIVQTSTSIWTDFDWQWGPHVFARAGLRLAILSYDVEDKLGNFTPASRPSDQSLPGFSRSAIGSNLGPRASVEVRPTPWFRLMAAYGEGYRSAQARTLEDGESAPFTEVKSGDAGLRFIVGEHIDLTASAYATYLSNDSVFEASEGVLTRVGASLRTGAVVYAKLRPTDWLLSSLSATYVHATLLEPPPPTASEPAPPFTKGQPLPYVPPLVLRLDTTVKTTLMRKLGAHTLEGRAGLGFTYLAPRPLPSNLSGESTALLDASLGVLWNRIDLSISGFNLLNLNYSARDYFYTSNWDPSTAPSRIAEKHINAGPPLSIMANLAITL